MNSIKYNQEYYAKKTNPIEMKDIPLINMIQGNPKTDKEFTFSLMSISVSRGPITYNPMPSGSVDGVKTISVIGSATAYFGTWEYSEEGIYHYKIIQNDPGDTEYDYDFTEYYLTDTVTNIGGQLRLERVVTNASNKVVEAYLYINTYNGSTSPDKEKPDDKDPSPKLGENPGNKPDDNTGNGPDLPFTGDTLILHY